RQLRGGRRGGQAGNGYGLARGGPGRGRGGGARHLGALEVGGVGGGPGGAPPPFPLARGGARVAAFDPPPPPPQPCGGGLTARALALLPPAPVGDPLPARFVRSCRFDSGAGDAVDVPLERDVAIASRRALDAWILRRATNAGARHVPERVVAVDAE